MLLRGVPRGTGPRRSEGRRGRDARLPARALPVRPARDGLRRRARRRTRRASPRRGPDRHREDGRRPASPSRRRARVAPPALRPHGEDDAAGDLRKDPGRHRRRVLSVREAPRERAHVRERRRAVPREPLPVREGLRRQDGGLGPPRPARREPPPPRPGHGLRGGPQRDRLPVRGLPRARRTGRRRPRRLQLRLRPGGRARGGARPVRALRLDPPRRRGAQPRGPRTRVLLARALRRFPGVARAAHRRLEREDGLGRGRGRAAPAQARRGRGRRTSRGRARARRPRDAGRGASRRPAPRLRVASRAPPRGPARRGRTRARRSRPRPLLLVRALSRRVETRAPARPCHVRGGLRRPRGARQGRRAARDPLQGPVEASRRDPERGGGHGLDVRHAFPARVLPRSPRTRPRPHVGAPPSLALSAGEPLRVRRAGRGHDVRGARARRPAPRGPRRGRGARVPGQHAGAVSVVPLSRRGARPPARADRRAASSGRPTARPSWSGTPSSRR